VCRFRRRGVALTAVLGVGCGILALCSPPVLAASAAPTGGAGAYVLSASFVRVAIDSTAPSQPPMPGELTVTG
jgi:hypothetical protein